MYCTALVHQWQHQVLHWWPCSSCAARHRCTGLLFVHHFPPSNVLTWLVAGELTDIRSDLHNYLQDLSSWWSNLYNHNYLKHSYTLNVRKGLETSVSSFTVSHCYSKQHINLLMDISTESWLAEAHCRGYAGRFQGEVQVVVHCRAGKEGTIATLHCLLPRKWGKK